MDKPHPWSYNKNGGESNYYDNSTKKWASESEIIKVSSPDTNASDPEVEDWGITLRQLCAGQANMEERWVKEKWRNCKGGLLTPDKVTLYDINKYIIKPFTAKKNNSCMAALPLIAGPQLPHVSISHWWRETANDFIKCLEQAVRDFSINRDNEDNQRRGWVTIDTPAWVCAYTNNQ